MENNVSPIVRDKVDTILKLCKRLSLYTVIVYLFLLILMVGVISIFKGPPFTNITIFEIPIYEAWAVKNPAVIWFLIIANAILSVVITVFYFKDIVDSFNNLVLEDCDAYAYLEVAELGATKCENRLAEIVFQPAYATALCLHGRFEEALEYAEPFKDDKRKKNIWLCVHMNTAESNEEFNQYYNQLKKKGLFEMVKLYRDGKYEETIKYVKDNIEFIPSYKAALGNFYLAKSYRALGDYENAFIAVSGTVAESTNLPYLKEKALELYKSLNQELVKIEE